MKIQPNLDLRPPLGHEVLSNIHKHEKSLPEAASRVIYDLLGQKRTSGLRVTIHRNQGPTQGFAQ